MIASSSDIRQLSWSIAGLVDLSEICAIFFLCEGRSEYSSGCRRRVQAKVNQNLKVRVRLNSKRCDSEDNRENDQMI